MADIQTVFGSINSIIDQTTNSLLKIKQGAAVTKGTLPTEPFKPVEADVWRENVSIIALVGVIAFMLYLLWRETK